MALIIPSLPNITLLQYFDITSLITPNPGRIKI